MVDQAGLAELEAFLVGRPADQSFESGRIPEAVPAAAFLIGLASVAQVQTMLAPSFHTIHPETAIGSIGLDLAFAIDLSGAIDSAGNDADLVSPFVEVAPLGAANGRRVAWFV